ncbi:MAG TPA: G-D-S-L family lipolytic protein, partial [Chitinophagaceae bacterium]|nr:G-D-S-L family lipolytic protein [Chitinophagaceae bacterium]
MKNNQRILAFLGASILLGSCQTDLVEKDIKKGNADFTRYVAVGNSLTGGYADGGLSLKGQLHSYHVMLDEL